LGGILRTFLPVLLPLLKLGKHKLRVLWHLTACGTPLLGANLFACRTAGIDTGHLAPVVIDIVRAAWLPKAGNGWKSRRGVSCQSFTTIASSLYQQSLIP
jgi:hypothetical protein